MDGAGWGGRHGRERHRCKGSLRPACPLGRADEGEKRGRTARVGGIRSCGAGQDGRGGRQGRGCLPRILCHVTVSTMCISLRKKGGLGSMTPTVSETTKWGKPR